MKLTVAQDIRTAPLEILTSSQRRRRQELELAFEYGRTNNRDELNSLILRRRSAWASLERAFWNGQLAARAEAQA